jgi:hypothetical protein
MNARAVVDKTEQIKWADALDCLCGLGRTRDVANGLQLAGECQHVDAQWLCSLFPDVGDTVTEEQVLNVMEGLGEDPRALFIRSCVGRVDDFMVRRAAELGYPPAQAALARWCGATAERFVWAHKAAAQGDRNGLYWLGYCCLHGEGCERDNSRAIAYWKEAAELGDGDSQFLFGRKPFAVSDWHRYHWWGKSAARGLHVAIIGLCEAAVLQLKVFEEGRASGRVVFELGAALKGNVNATSATVFDERVEVEELKAVQRCIELHDEWTAAAKVAIECWIAVGMRHGVVKDVIRLIAWMLWTERAAWSVARNEESVD